NTTSTPPMPPMTKAAHASTAPHGAVIETRPANTPLPIMARSGLPALSEIVTVQNRPPAIDASKVFTPTVITYSSASSSEPGLNPNQPTQRMNTPRIANGMVWAGIARGLAFASYLPMRGPRKIAPIRAAMPPVMWTMPDPAKSEYWIASPKLTSWAMKPPPHVQWTTTG